MSALTVVKLGGSLLDSPDARSLALGAVATATDAGTPIVLVHGGGKAVDASLSRLGIPKRTCDGLRVTDSGTLEVVISVLAGTVNKSLVAELISIGVPAAGISAADGGTIVARLHPPIDGVNLGFVGDPAGANPALPLALLRAGFLPVIASIAIGGGGTLLNVNADAAASSIAVALAARRLVFMTDVEGVLSPDGQVIGSIRRSDAVELLASSGVSGGMRPKLRACLGALSGGVPEVLIAGPSTHSSSLVDGKGGTHLVAA